MIINRKVSIPYKCVINLRKGVRYNMNRDCIHLLNLYRIYENCKIQCSYIPRKNITFSSRNNKNLMSLPKNKNRHFLYNASIIWNLSINRVGIPKIHEISPNVFKSRLKHFLIINQSNGNEYIWSEHNTKYHLFTNTKSTKT